MQFNTILTNTGGGNYIPIDETRAKGIIEKIGKRVICEINGYRFHCAILRKNRIGYYIMASKATVKKIKAEVGDELFVKIEPDTTKYQGLMPEELEAVLQTDPEALAVFEKLTAGRKRSMMHWVNSAKQIDTRINRALNIAYNLKLGIIRPQDFVK